MEEKLYLLPKNNGEITQREERTRIHCPLRLLLEHFNLSFFLLPTSTWETKWTSMAQPTLDSPFSWSPGNGQHCLVLIGGATVSPSWANKWMSDWELVGSVVTIPEKYLKNKNKNSRKKLMKTFMVRYYKLLTSSKTNFFRVAPKVKTRITTFVRLFRDTPKVCQQLGLHLWVHMNDIPVVLSFFL